MRRGRDTPRQGVLQVLPPVFLLFPAVTRTKGAGGKEHERTRGKATSSGASVCVVWAGDAVQRAKGGDSRELGG